ncbi:hypothetical protein DAPPUDRAFT_301970 [Daphnia pulex]|uniref:Amine oxidase domain-containing protein n=1 Tax=Daphnia pulex TaxID=6669 RepID=E9GB74_DAPPU|nr:hypothetical protein DAPPUDRAFT_301970 [Daphnia pulex]|eukprot:EFX83379.1 hypothetical protein DAPPUDRAFT_301970 [Daphnia pulex]
MKHVIIVGAGASGLAAASRLVENGLSATNITILEAQNHIGGRVHTVTNDGNPLEIGAQWVHGQQGNVVFEIAESAHELNTDIQTLESSGFAENVVFGFEDYKLNKEQVQQFMQTVHSLEEISKSELSGWNKSFGEYFEEKFNELIFSKCSHSEFDRSTALAFLDWYHIMENVIDGADNWKETCGSGHLHYKECSGDPLVTWKRGYSTLFKILMKNLSKSHSDQQLPLSDRIFLNKAVTNIDWDSEATSEKKIQVTCEDGSLYPADFVLVTASLGFLKSNMHSLFIPALPTYKKRAIQGLGFGTVDKIFIKFAKPWWTTDWGGISLLRRRSQEADSHWSDHLLGFYTVRLHPNMLIAWITGKAARQVESLPENEILKVCSDLLRKYIGADFPFTEPVGLILSKWFSNPFTVGSYSYRSMESKEMNVWAADLALPVYDSNGFPRLFFAGEATHDCMYSTVHGAVETGWREADRIAKYCIGFHNAKL